MGNDLTGLLKKDVNVMKIVGMATTIESNSRNVKQKKKKILSPASLFHISSTVWKFAFSAQYGYKPYLENYAF